VEIDLGDSGITYSPGDALGICPSNRPEVRPQLPIGWSTVHGAVSCIFVCWRWSHPKPYTLKLWALLAACESMSMRLAAPLQ